ncbi:MAG: VWA domain-containing protein [Deltaproteobacteria bacterium]|nr:VWA domain-containing protein [Deltaproteobacteria bacterium]
MVPMPSPRTDPIAQPSSGGRLVAADGRSLPLRSASLEADARGGLARVRLEQRFANPHPEPLRVSYQLPLPADAAVSGYCFTIGERRVVGEVDRRQAARERFELAVLEGRTAALLEQERSSLFSQELGNIPPGEELTVEIAIDQKLDWLHRGAWEWRFPTVVAPRYLGEEGRVADAERVSVEVAEGPMPPRVDLCLGIRDALASSDGPESPSHAIVASREGEATRVRLRTEAGAALDRDLVVRWDVASEKPGAGIDLARPADPVSGAYGLLSLVPPRPEEQDRGLARDLIVLIDCSGSMRGEPLDQARRAVGSLVESLDERDSLELLEFSTSARRFRRKPAPATPELRAEALAWLGKLRAGGATEMHSAIQAALEPVHAESQRQVVLVTDGLIGFEEQVVALIASSLPRGSRLHTLGVGSSVNRSLTGAAARAGRGVEVLIGLGEDHKPAAEAILARTAAPLVVDLEIEGDAVERCAPACLPDLFAAAPARIALRLRPGGGRLAVRGRTQTGDWRTELQIPPVQPGEGSPAVIALYGREAVEDLEMRRAAGEGEALDAQIEALGLEYQIATRLSSWVAVSETVDVDSGQPVRRERMPQELPFGLSAAGLGLRPTTAPQRMHRAFPSLDAGSRLLRSMLSAPAPRAEEMRPPSGPPAGPRARAKLSRPISHEAVRGFGAVAGPAGPAVRELGGRLVLAGEDRMVIEILVEGAPLDWQAPAEVELEDASGARVTAGVSAAKSTRRGQIAPGLRIRLVLEPLAGKLPLQPETLRMQVDGVSILVRIR